MLSYRGLSKRPETFRSFTGLEVSEFESVYLKVESKYEEFERKRLSRRDRKNEIGAGHPFRLPLRDRLLMLFVYYRTYVTSTLAGFLLCSSYRKGNSRIAQYDRHKTSFLNM